MKFMGIVNITPNASSDGGLYCQEERALERIKEMLEHGVEIVDVGAESINQFATKITLEEERSRLIKIFPKIVKLVHDKGALVSIDTYKPEIAEMCLEFGVDIINDMNGLRDRSMLELINNTDKPVIVSHSLTIPANFEITIPPEADAVQEICNWMEKISEIVPNTNQLIFDPGIGFGKTRDHDWSLVRNAQTLKKKSEQLGGKLCFGYSRKSFMGDIDRESGTLAISALMLRDQVDIIRIHNTLLHSWFFNKLVPKHSLVMAS